MTMRDLNRAIRFRDVFQTVPEYHQLKTSDVQRAIKADWEPWIGNTKRKSK